MDTKVGRPPCRLDICLLLDRRDAIVAMSELPITVSDLTPPTHHLMTKTGMSSIARVRLLILMIRSSFARGQAEDTSPFPPFTSTGLCVRYKGRS